MITIDGSQGEGGGQVLRTALSLSAITGEPFRIHSIRKSRRKDGLARQHLTGVRAAAKICGAVVRGDALRSTELRFHPGKVFSGEYEFAIGTAGSANLVLQTVLPPLMLAKGQSLLTLKGGTHNDNSPPYDYLRRVFVPVLERMGPRVELDLHSWGFYPAGGGEFTAMITPVEKLKPLELRERGAVQRISPTAVVSAVPFSVGKRELRAVAEHLELGTDRGRVVDVPDPQGPGNVLMIEVQSEHITELFTGFGRKGLSGKHLAAQVCAEVQEYLDVGAPVGTNLADQLLLPMALAGRGSFITMCPDPHTPTNAEVISQFLGVEIEIERATELTWAVTVG